VTKASLSRKEKETHRSRCGTEESEVVFGCEVGVEHAKVPLGDGAWLLVLVEEGEDVGLEGVARHERRALASAADPDEAGVEVLGLLDADAELPGLALGGPSGLADGDLDVAVAELLHGGVDGVHLCVEHAGVVEPGGGVVDAGVGAEDGVVERAVVVAEVGVRVDHERGGGVVEEPEHGREHLCGELRAEGGVGGDAVGGREDAEVVRRGDAHLGQARLLERLVEAAHGGEQRDHEVWVDDGAEISLPARRSVTLAPGMCGERLSRTQPRAASRPVSLSASDGRRELGRETARETVGALAARKAGLASKSLMRSMVVLVATKEATESGVGRLSP
jgi:hypothetical protein